MSTNEGKSHQWWAIVLVAALGLVLAVFASQTRLGRTTNLALPGDFVEVYVQFKVGDPGRCLVTDRAGSTARRSEPELQAARWRCLRSGEGGEGLLTLDGKRASFLFVPYEKVVDPVFPFLYELLRHAEGEPALPRLRWVHLFVDRTYRGFYLQVTLPTRDFFEEKQLGELETLVLLGGEQGTWLDCFDRKMRNLCPIYGGLVAESIFPQPTYSPAARTLEALLPPELPRAFLLSEKGADSLRAWPLPFAFSQLVSGDAKPFYDQRFFRWSLEGAATGTVGLPLPVPAPPELEAKKLAERLHGALVASCQARGCSADELGGRIEASPAWAILAGGAR